MGAARAGRSVAPCRVGISESLVTALSAETGPPDVRSDTNSFGTVLE